VNVLQPYADSFAVDEALFGSDLVVPQGELEFSLKRAGDGIFIGPKGPHNTRLSGVLFAMSVFPTTVAVADVFLYHHPRARYPYTGPLCGLKQFRLGSNGPEELKGRSTKDVLGIDTSWLGEGV
jgi:hypothetical protein